MKEKDLLVEAMHKWLSGHIITMGDLHRWIRLNGLYKTYKHWGNFVHFADQFDADHPNGDRMAVYHTMMHLVRRYYE